MTFVISPSPRIRRSPYYESTVADGVVSFSSYNRMLMPTGYGDPSAEYWRLINGVAMWDVAVERQVEITGPDAAKLVQILTPRKLAGLKVGVGWYVAVCDHRGVLINDPILLKLAEDRFWFSIADRDITLWARAIAAERQLDVQIHDAQVSPMAIQGPQAGAVALELLGEEVSSIRHFHFRPMSVNGIELLVARSGWSKQGGYELYLLDPTQGAALWQSVKQAGKDYDIGPGCPNAIERVESGLLSFGGDTDDETNPFEVRLGRYVDLDAPDDVVGIKALREIHAQGPQRHQLGVFIDSPTPLSPSDKNSPLSLGGSIVGQVTAQAWSPRLQRNIGICLLSTQAQAGDRVQIQLDDVYAVDGELCELPFL